MTSFQALELNQKILTTVSEQGFTEPTDIQQQAIPPLMAGNDVMGVAQTGGGKTAAFVLPILDQLFQEGKRSQPNSPNVLILAPTRELASQIGAAIYTFSKGLRVFHTVAFGGAPFGPQIKALQRGVHILVATPGRLMDHVRRGNINFSNTKTFILDEADRMLDMGFIGDVKQIAEDLPQPHQTIMFSATMNTGIKGLASKLLSDPVYIEASQESKVADTIDHRVMCVRQKDKGHLLAHLLEDKALARVIIFTRTKSMADTLAKTVRELGRRSDAIHGDLQQRIRQKVLRRFREGQIEVLVATDVAARGIDVPDITHVVNYDMPLEAESYVHRVGRTGRAGNQGVALSICEIREGNLLRMVEKAIRQSVPVDAEHPFHADLVAEHRPAGRGRGKGGGGRRGGHGGRGRGHGSGGGNANAGGYRGRRSRSDGQNNGGGEHHRKRRGGDKGRSRPHAA